MIMAKPAHTMPSTRAEKLRGVPSPIPLFNKTPHANLSSVSNIEIEIEIENWNEFQQHCFVIFSSSSFVPFFCVCLFVRCACEFK